jgi:hypothetical protein
MRIRNRLRLLEQRASAARLAGDVETVEIWLPNNGRGGLPPGRYPGAGTPTVLIIYEPTTTPPMEEAQP